MSPPLSTRWLGRNSEPLIGQPALTAKPVRVTVAAPPRIQKGLPCSEALNWAVSTVQVQLSIIEVLVHGVAGSVR
jgi:hypothetical protein